MYSFPTTNPPPDGALAQDFAWTEADMPRLRAERGSSLEGEAAAKLAAEPMFCFEVGSCLEVA